MKALSEKELVRILNANGYKLIRQSGHQIFSNGEINVAVPRSRKNLSFVICRFVLRKAGIIVEGVT